MTHPPLISVVVPCHNGAAFLTGAVQSVRTPNGPPTEVIVVDDVSTDDSAAVADRLAADPSVRVVRRTTNGGPAAARNTGLRAAVGGYVAFLDADDEYAPGFLTAATRILDADPTVAGLVTGVELLDCHRPVDPVQLDAITRSIPTNLLLRRAAVDLLGGFSEDPRFRGPLGGEDIAFRTALSRHFRLARTDHRYLRYRVRRGSHFDLFLDRTAVIDGRLVFTGQTADEQSGRVLDRQADPSISTEFGTGSSTHDATGCPEPDAPAPWIVDPRCAHTVTTPTTHFTDRTMATRTPTPRPASGSEPGAGDPADLIKTGVALAQQGRVADALPLFERAVRLAPHHPPARLNLGAALAASGRSDDAADQLREAVRLKPDYAEAHFNLGNVLRDAGRTAEAIDHFRTAVPECSSPTTPGR